MSSTFGMSSAAAPRRSACSAMRLRSRHCSCMTGSTPSSLTARLAAQLASRATALCPSVRLAASTQPRRSRAFLRTGSRVAPRGGPISAVTTNRPARRAASSVLNGWSAVSGPPPAAPFVDTPLEPTQVGDTASLLRALVSHEPDAAQLRIDLTVPRGRDPTARPVAKLLRTRHRARVGGGGEGALGAHAAAEEPLLGYLF